MEDCEILGEYMVANECTVRAIADEFGISKSTVHYKVTTVLEVVNPTLARRVRVVLNKNLAERSHRAGRATAAVRRQEKVRRLAERKKSTIGVR